MTAGAGPHSGGPAVGAGSGPIVRIAAFLALTLAYLMTAPANHAISVDPYFFARMITEEPLDGVPHPRLMLWVLAMQALHRTAAAVVPDPDLFAIAALVNAALTALAVLLVARILRRDFALDPVAAGLTAALFGASYGIWRYATELEVYAAAVLVSLALVHLAFGLERAPPGSAPRRVAQLGAAAGLAVLVYQPIGLLSGAAIPFYLLLSGRRRLLPLYGAIAGAIILAGFGIGDLLGNRAGRAAAVDFVLQTHELHPGWPTPMTAVAVLYALGSDILSANWILAFAPIEHLAARAAPDLILDEGVYAATRAGWLPWVGLATLPAAAVFFLAMVRAAWRQPLRGGLGARGMTLALWLVLHAAMMTALSPGGSEGWLLALVPLGLLAGLGLVAPAVVAGRGATVAALAAVVVLHNGLAGIGILFHASGDYYLARGTGIVGRAGRGDLILFATNWNLQQYLAYATPARILRIDESGVAEARRAIEATRAEGGSIFVLDDVATPPATLLRDRPDLVPELAALARDHLATARRFATGDAGWAYEIAPPPAGP